MDFKSFFSTYKEVKLTIISKKKVQDLLKNTHYNTLFILKKSNK